MEISFQSLGREAVPSNEDDVETYQRGGKVRGRKGKKKLITLKATQKQVVNINLTRGRGGGGSKKPPTYRREFPSVSFQQPINFGNLQQQPQAQAQPQRPEKFYDMVRDLMRQDGRRDVLEPNQPQRGVEPIRGVSPPRYDQREDNPRPDVVQPLEEEKEEIPPLEEEKEPVEEEIPPPLFEKSQVNYDISRIGELPVGSGKQSQGTKQEIIAILAKYNIVLKPTVYSKSLNIIKDKAIKKLAGLNV